MWKPTPVWLRKKSADTKLTALKERCFILTSNRPSVQKSTVLAGKFWFKKKPNQEKSPQTKRTPTPVFINTLSLHECYSLPLTIQLTVQHLESFISIYK